MPTGPKTWMWTYGGSFPGPTIKRPAGSITKVTFVNDLPAGAGLMTVHQHGGHQSSADDGQPTRHLIATGARRTYTYPLTRRRQAAPGRLPLLPRPPDGPDGREQLARPPGDVPGHRRAGRRLGLPHGAYDVPLHLTDRSLTADNQLTDPFPGHDMHDWMTGPQAPPNDATVGKRILVNGQFAPYLRVEPALYRLRLLNASTFSAYDLALSDGRPFVQVGHRQRAAPPERRAPGHPARAGPTRRRGRRLPGHARRGRHPLHGPAHRHHARHRLEVGGDHAVPGPRDGAPALPCARPAAARPRARRAPRRSPRSGRSG